MKKIIDQSREIKKKIDSLEFDVHWYRRVFHAFGASFIFYYMLPDVYWINTIKFWGPPFLVVFAISLEVLRLKGKLSSDHFFGLRMYEKNRIGSYAFFAVAILILLRFFPQQITIPCILCATLGDPLIGELRYRFRMNYVYIFGFLFCMFFFMIAWSKTDSSLMLFASIVGGIGAVIGETKKFWWLDDDFMIQMIPAILLLIIWFSLPFIGLAEPGEIIYPSVVPWLS